MARRWMVWSTPGRRLLYLLCRVRSAIPWGVIVSQVGQEVWHVYVGGLVYFWAGSALLLTGLVQFFIFFVGRVCSTLGRCLHYFSGHSRQSSLVVWPTF